ALSVQMLDRHARRHVSCRFNRQYRYRVLATVRHDQREVLIERVEIPRHSVAGYNRWPHANDNRACCSGWKPDALHIVAEVFLTAYRRVLTRKMIPVVDYSPNDHLKIELVHIRRSRHRTPWRIGPHQHHSNLLPRVRYNAGRFKRRAAALREGP